MIQVLARIIGTRRARPLPQRGGGRGGLDSSVSCSEFSVGGGDGGATCVLRELCLRDHSDATVL